MKNCTEAIRQFLVLPKYDWEVFIYYCVTGIQIDEVLSLLRSIGVSDYDYSEA